MLQLALILHEHGPFQTLKELADSEDPPRVVLIFISTLCKDAILYYIF